MSHHHRSLFKQKNKPFKGKSKGKQKAKFAGRTEQRTNIKKANNFTNDSRLDRINKSKQIQQNKRAKLLQKRRIGSRTGPPKIIGIIGLNNNIDLTTLGGLIKEYIGINNGRIMYSNRPNQHTFMCKIDNKQQKFIIYLSPPKDPIAALDIAKVADILIMVVCPNINDPANGEVIDDFGYYITTLIKNQGVCNIIGLIQGLNQYNNDNKTKQASKKLCTRYIHTLFDNKTKVVTVDEMNDINTLMRWIHTQTPKAIHWRNQRSYMLAEAFNYDMNTKTLQVIGYLRGEMGLNVNDLVHITGYDDYQLSQIDKVEHTNKYDDRINKHNDNEITKSNQLSMDSPPTHQILQQSKPEERTELTSLQPLDPFATYNDQSIITEEEIKEAEELNSRQTIQSVWDDIAPIDEEDDDEEDIQKNGINNPQIDNNDMDINMNNDDVNNMNDDDDDNNMNMNNDDDMNEGNNDTMDDMIAERKRLKELEADEMKWPDEVETPIDKPARERFTKYRGLQSFRHSPWDKYENLPLEYSRIFSFQNFVATRRRVLNAKQALLSSNIINNNNNQMNVDNITTDIPNGTAVCLYLCNISMDVATNIMNSSLPICIWGLLQYERKVSILNFAVRRRDDDIDEPIKNKAPMIFHVGFRRFIAKPIYTRHTKGDKHLVERFFQKNNRYSVASVYQRIIYTPAPVIMMRLPESLPISRTLNPIVATGSLLSVDPNRLLIKRVVLSGYPINVHRRAAVVRYMFFNPDDIRYFKKIELFTKHGHVGHIREPRGLKGYMKCIFNNHIKQHDVICMSLYKRQYIPWNPQFENEDDKQIETL